MRNRKFESISLQRRVRCEPNFCPALLEAGKIAHSMLFGVGDDFGYLWRSGDRNTLPLLEVDR
jgi:hypothetical protein